MVLYSVMYRCGYWFLGESDASLQSSKASSIMLEDPSNLSDVVETITPVTAGLVAQEEVNPEILSLLGEEPRGSERVFGAEVHQALASRWNSFIRSGIEKSAKEDLEKKYLIPANLPHLRAPLLNPELESSITDAAKKDDKYVSTIQSHMGVAMGALAGAIDKLFKEDLTLADVKSQVLPSLVDAGKLLCDTFHMLSTNRKYHVEGHLNPAVRKIVKESQPDEFLCGKNLGERFKEQKVQWKTGKEMVSAYPHSSKHYSSKPTAGPSGVYTRNNTSTKSLNYRTSLPKGRLKDRVKQQLPRKVNYRTSSYRNKYHK